MFDAECERTSRVVARLLARHPRIRPHRTANGRVRLLAAGRDGWLLSCQVELAPEMSDAEMEQRVDEMVAAMEATGP